MELVKIKSFPSFLQFNAHPFLNFAHLNKTIVTLSKHEFYSKTWNRKYPDEHIGFWHMEIKIIMIIVFVMLSWSKMVNVNARTQDSSQQCHNRINQKDSTAQSLPYHWWMWEEWKKIKWILGKWRVLCKIEYNMGVSLKLFRAEKNKIKRVLSTLRY